MDHPERVAMYVKLYTQQECADCRRNLAVGELGVPLKPEIGSGSVWFSEELTRGGNPC